MRHSIIEYLKKTEIGAYLSFIMYFGLKVGGRKMTQDDKVGLRVSLIASKLMLPHTRVYENGTNGFW